jgi:hypothetical protein
MGLFARHGMNNEDGNAQQHCNGACSIPDKAQLKWRWHGQEHIIDAGGLFARNC